MTADVLTMPLVPDFLGHLESHLHRELAAVIQDWSRCVNVLKQWEDEHLLDAPTPDSLAQHKQAIERLLRFGRFLALATEQPDFPDKPLAEIVTATQSCLRDKIPLWHGTMSEERRAEILKACFNDSPELDRILAALYERDTCEPSDRPKCDATVNRLVADALQKQPGT